MHVELCIPFTVPLPEVCVSGEGEGGEGGREPAREMLKPTVRHTNRERERERARERECVCVCTHTHIVANAYNTTPSDIYVNVCIVHIGIQ